MQHSGPVFCQFFTDSYQFGSQPEEGWLVFCIFLEGHGSFHLGERVLDLDKPGAFIFSSFQAFSIRGRGRVSLLKCRNAYVSSLFKGGVGASLVSLLPSAASGLFKAFFLSEHSVQRLMNILNIINEETGLRRSDYLDMVHFQIYEILILLRREGALTNERVKEWLSRQKVWNIDDVASFILSNFDIIFSLEELASRCDLNPSYFSRLFREKTGVPLFEYINRVRIERAVHLLKNSSMTILGIAMTVGYNNVSFFNRYFRKLKGCSPGEYRRKITK